MNIVIPLIESKNDNVELRYTLRSLEAYYGQFELMLIGYCPKWLAGATVVNFLHVFGASRKEPNIANKLLLASEIIADKFLYSLDDNYILPTYRDIVRYKASIAQTCAETKSGHYRKSCENTMNALGHDSIDFDLHCPAWIEPEKFLHVYHHHNFNQDFGLLVKSTYFNHIMPACNLSADIKIRTPLRSLEHLRNVEFFSTHESAINKQMILFLESLFPEKSRFEG
jgi:hypothetical protein